MRLIDADAFKKYCEDGLEDMKSLFKTESGLELAIKTTESFLKDIDEQPTVEAVPVSKINEAKGKMERGLQNCLNMVHCESNYDLLEGQEKAFKYCLEVLKEACDGT